MVTKHADQNDVKEYIALAKKSPNTRKTRRTDITNRIRHLGNRLFNLEVASGERRGGFMPATRAHHDQRTVTNVSHVSCKHCSGMYRKDSMYRHVINCKQYRGRGSDESPARKMKRVLSKHADLVVNRHGHAAKLLRDEVFPKMQVDAQSVAAQGDSLICKFGSDFRFTHRGTKQVRYVSSRMRSLARLLLIMKEIDPDIKEFSECIRPKHFDLLTESVRRMSKFEIGTGDTKAPSVPPRLCSSLKRCANIMKSETLKSDTLTRAEKFELGCEIDDFLHLMDKDWATEVGTISEKSRKKKLATRDDKIPECDDIRTFHQYIDKLCPGYVTGLRLVPTVKNYEKLAKLVIAFIISFNRRRPNETVEITIEAYRSTLNKRTNYGEGDVGDDVLTKEELESGRELVIFYIAANKNLKKVPVLLTKTFHEAIEALIESHQTVGIKSKYVFARHGTTDLFDGSAVFREVVNKANLKNPAYFTANTLRHHAATSSQLQTRNDTYVKRLSKFMGHDLRTHENFYEMPLPLVQKSIVGHRLLQMTLPKRAKEKSCTVTSASCASEPSHDQLPTASHTQAQKEQESSSDTLLYYELPELDTEPIRPTELEKSPPRAGAASASNTTQQCRTNKRARSKRADRGERSSVQRPSGAEKGRCDRSEVSEDNVATTSVETHRRCRLNERPTALSLEKDAADSPPTVCRDTPPLGTPSDGSLSQSTDTPPAKKKHKKKRWTLEERNAVYATFGKQFILKMKPTRQEIKQCWEAEPALSNRTLDQVVVYVNNIVNDKHHIPTPTRQKIKNMVARGDKKLSP